MELRDLVEKVVDLEQFKFFYMTFFLVSGLCLVIVVFLKLDITILAAVAWMFF